MGGRGWRSVGERGGERGGNDTRAESRTVHTEYARMSELLTWQLTLGLNPLEVVPK